MSKSHPGRITCCSDEIYIFVCLICVCLTCWVCVYCVVVVCVCDVCSLAFAIDWTCFFGCEDDTGGVGGCSRFIELLRSFASGGGKLEDLSCLGGLPLRFFGTTRVNSMASTGGGGLPPDEADIALNSLCYTRVCVFTIFGNSIAMNVVYKQYSDNAQSGADTSALYACQNPNPKSSIKAPFPL